MPTNDTVAEQKYVSISQDMFRNLLASSAFRAGAEEILCANWDDYSDSERMRYIRSIFRSTMGRDPEVVR